ncbi:BMP family ABC transporter substrate-binding protein [Clostridium rectalis]|uniref:BMP family ABC transporter substrate-binding protein n=1 Tax=Clostridium rectalis TaxID=2040295 RepID=UPI000F63BDFD|nr:BMP family ABC transporter substrate-binding protein [Clostridium rectalis]
MKKFLTLVLSCVMLLSLTLTGCGSKESAEGNASDKELKVVLVLNGNLGDKSFFDSSSEGMKLIEKELGAKTKVIELGYDDTKWEPALADVSEEDWDIIVCGTWQMKEPLEKVAAQHKDKKYIFFDSSVDYDKGDFSNVYSILYKQNEGSFLAGALAAKITSSNLPLANKEKVIGFVGGAENQVVNDFLVGYINGAKYVDPEIKVATSYIGDFKNSAKGKELALAQYNQKADVIFPVASQAGLGALDAAKIQNKYAIGVDSDQAMLFKSSDSAKAQLIATSVLKRVDNSLVRAIKLEKEGALKWGKAEELGIKEEAIGIAENEYYEKLIPEDMKKVIKDLSKKIVSGEIKVDSAFGMETSKLSQLRNSVKP